jgi:AraC-like DNA-binding protein
MKNSNASFESFEKYLYRDWIDEKENISVIKYMTNKKEKLHTHEFIEIEYIWSGSGTQNVNGVEYDVVRGDLLFLNYEDKHSYSPDEELGMFNCILTPKFVSEQLINSENAMDILALSSFSDFNDSLEIIKPKIRFSGEGLLEIENLLEIMYAEFTAKQPGYLTVLKSCLKVMLTKVLRIIKSGDKINMYSGIAGIAPQVLKYIEKNYDKKLTIKELADISFLHPTYFSKVFKDCFGKTPGEYISEIRFNAAVKLLKESDQTIEDISYAVGYKDKKQLYKLFRDFTGTTPVKFKNQI